MNTHSIDTLMHAIKPDGHGANPLATELHKLACTAQEMFDKAYEALYVVRNPQFKGDVVGELVPWPGHFPLELDHTGEFLNDIFVRGVSVSEHLAAGLWEEAEAYVKERFGPEMSDSTRRTIARMDAADLRLIKTLVEMPCSLAMALSEARSSTGKAKVSVERHAFPLGLWIPHPSSR